MSDAMTRLAWHADAEWQSCRNLESPDSLYPEGNFTFALLLGLPPTFYLPLVLRDPLL